MYNPKLPSGTKVIRHNHDGQLLGTVYQCYGDLPHSAVAVHDIINLKTGEMLELPMTWLLGEIEICQETVTSNPLPFDEGA